MVNNHFMEESLLFVKVDQGSVDRALFHLETFCRAFDVTVSPHKTNFLAHCGGLSSNMDFDSLITRGLLCSIMAYHLVQVDH